MNQARCETFKPVHKDGLARLVNANLDAVVPGWALPTDVIVSRLQVNPDQYVLDPWVQARETFCVLRGHRMLAAAHVLGYGTTGTGHSYRGTCDIAWLLALEGEDEAANEVLDAALEWAKRRRARAVVALDAQLPVPLISGLPSSWATVGRALRSRGFLPSPGEAVIWAGGLGDRRVDPPPRLALELVREASDFGLGFRAVHDGESIGLCDVVSDLTAGGERPSLVRWGQLGDLRVEPEWRGRGIGAWLLSEALDWLALAGCRRIALSAAHADLERGGARFYRQFGWEPITRLTLGWKLGRPAREGNDGPSEGR